MWIDPVCFPAEVGSGFEAFGRDDVDFGPHGRWLSCHQVKTSSYYSEPPSKQTLLPLPPARKLIIARGIMRKSPRENH